MKKNIIPYNLFIRGCAKKSALRIFLFGVVFLPVIFLSPAYSQVSPYRYVKVEGARLMVDFNRTGTYKPYFIKGVDYSPMPVGRHPSDWGYPVGNPRIKNIFADPEILNRDFALLNVMHANTIRIWKGNDTEADGRFPNKITQATLDRAQAYNIKVIAGFWVDVIGASTCGPGGPGYQTYLDLTNPTVRSGIISKFQAYVSSFKDHPAILFWAIGNENNYQLNPNNPAQIAAWYSLVDEMATAAHAIEGEFYHPVAVVNGDLQYIGDAAFGSTDYQLPHLDIWGVNVYRGDSFGQLFNDYKLKSSKPLWIAEFGLEAWNSVTYQNPNAGQEDPTNQALWAGKLWDEIAQQYDVSVGGSIMEYSDEWWKPYEWLCADPPASCNLVHNRFGVGPLDNSCPADGVLDWYPAAPDNFMHEEWFGIVAVTPDNDPLKVDTVTPRSVYSTLQNKFSLSPFPPVVDPIGNKSVIVGQLLQFTVTAKDPEQQSLQLTARLASGALLSTIGATFIDNGNGTGVFQWTPTAAYLANPYAIVFTAKDLDGLSDSKTAFITVQVPQRIDPERVTVNSGQVAKMTFGVPIDAVSSKLYMYCPAGLTIGLGATSNICNTWLPLSLPANSQTEQQFRVTNTTATVLKAVPNFYIYKASNPNYGYGVSGEITVNPPVCGDRIKNGAEMCDSNTQACTINGYAGTQSCLSNCTGYGTCVRSSITLNTSAWKSTYAVGETIPIKWTSTGVNTVKINLMNYKGNTLVRTIATVPAAGGQYNWVVSNIDFNDDDIYTFMIVDASNATIKSIKSSKVQFIP